MTRKGVFTCLALLLLAIDFIFWGLTGRFDGIGFFNATVGAANALWWHYLLNQD